MSNLRTMSIVDALAADLRTNLFQGNLTQKDQLTEAAVASTYDVARPTAKAAIEKLVTEGLLQRGPHKTARVPEMTADDVKDLFLMRMCIETEAVRCLALSGTVPPELLSANEDHLMLEENSNGLSPIIEPTVGFHASVVAALNSPRLNRVFQTIGGEIRLCMAQMERRDVLQHDAILSEHHQIVDCIRSSDVDGAVNSMRAHLTNAQNRVAPDC